MENMRKFMLKTLSGVMILSLLLSLTACGQLEANTPTSTELETTVLQEEEPDQASSPSQKEVQATPSLENLVRNRPTPPAFEGVARHRYQEQKSKDENFSITIDLPEILLDSPDAVKVNREIESLEATLVKTYEDYFGESADSEENYFCYQNAYYSAYARNNILSICIVVEDNLGEYTSGHYIYNFNLADASLLTDQDLIKLVTGQSPDQNLVWERNIASASQRVGSEFELQLMGQNYAEDSVSPLYFGAADNLVGRTLLNYREQDYDANNHLDRSPEASRLFIDSAGSLKMVYGHLAYAGAGFYYSVEDFNPYCFPNERELNPLFVELESRRGRDPWSSSCQALIAYIGSGTDSESLQKILPKISAVKISSNYYLDPSPLLSYVESEETNWQRRGTFTDLYLLIPKYKHDVVEMLDLELTDSGELKEDQTQAWSNNHAGMNFNLVGISAETIPSAGLKISNMMSEGELWYPSFSGKDGSFILPDFIEDFTKDLDEIAGLYDPDELWAKDNLLDYILSFSSTN